MRERELEYTESRHLDVQLTDEEIKQFGEDLAHRLMDISALELERTRLNIKIKPIKEEVEQLVQKIDSKIEVRPVDCDWHFDWKKGTKELFRSDTGEAIKGTKADIAEWEKQLNLEQS